MITHPLKIITIATLGASLAGGAAAQTMTSVRTDSAPVIDGVGGDEWSAAEPISVPVSLLFYQPSNGYDGITQSTVEMRAMHDDDTLYMLIEWDDPTKSLERYPWVKQEDGSWEQLVNKDSTGHENTYYEDKFAVLWDINARGFDKKGCDAACHMAQDGMVNGIPDTSAGRKYTTRPGQTIDMWHWKAARVLQVGQVDDQFIDDTTDPEQNSGWGRKGDSKTGGGYANNRNADKTAPTYMPADGSTGYDLLTKAAAVPFEDNFVAGTVLPGIVSEPFTGSRGDISADAKYENGKWTLEVRRALVTSGENAEAQDVQFDDMSKEYPFGVAVFDNAQINHVYHEGVLNLRFAN